MRYQKQKSKATEKHRREGTNLKKIVSVHDGIPLNKFRSTRIRKIPKYIFECSWICLKTNTKWLPENYIISFSGLDKIGASAKCLFWNWLLISCYIFVVANTQPWEKKPNGPKSLLKVANYCYYGACMGRVFPQQFILGHIDFLTSRCYGFCTWIGWGAGLGRSYSWGFKPMRS